jgi:hypothetical protein
MSKLDHKSFSVHPDVAAPWHCTGSAVLLLSQYSQHTMLDLRQRLSDLSIDGVGRSDVGFCDLLPAMDG